MCPSTVTAMAKLLSLIQLCFALVCLRGAFSQSGCYNRTRERLLDQIGFETRTWYSVSENDSHSGSRVLANLEWNITNADLEPEGFAVFFGVKTNSYSMTAKSMLPINVCTKPGLFWVASTNGSVCTDVTTGCPAMTSECLCATECPLFSNARGRYCEGSVLVEMDGFVSVPASVRHLEFDITSTGQTSFKAEIAPYYRQESALDPTRVEFDDLTCSGLTKTSSYQESIEQCCRMKLKDGIVRNVSMGEQRPDFKQQTVSMNMTWMLPLKQDGLLRFDVELGNEWPANVVKAMNHTFIPFKGNASQLASCENHTHMYQITLTGLVPATSFELVIRPHYQDQIGNGAERRVLVTVSVVNSCQERYHYCDEHSNCTAQDATGLRSIKAFCQCNPGFSGDGVNMSTVGLGTGCVDINRCHVDPSPCDARADCHDNPAPLLTANCSCLAGYFGDGYVDGSGCSSTNVYALAIALPVTLVLLIVIVGVAWMIRTRKLRQENLKWSSFVANTALQYSIPSTNKDQNVWLPTFGEKWEVGRERIKLGEILGRGNYGVVYKGSLTPLKKDEMVEDIDVAVKFVKEGANVEEKISDFLTEIGFMLNVGEHPNVIKVIGCSTTEKPILLITELLKYGDLLHFLWDAREPTKCLEDPVYHLTESSVFDMSRQVAQGMAYLTRSRIIHGDLAARNILVGEGAVCKISDFGLANDVYRYGVIRGQTERTVPFKWISPERMMSGKVPITSKSDVWSFGNLIYEMITLGCMPHPGVSSDELFDKLKAGYRMKQPASCGDKMYGIMKRCWRWKASSRPTFADLVKMLVHEEEDKTSADYVNIVKVVETIDKEQYDHDIDESTKKSENSPKIDGDYKKNLMYYNKALMGEDMEKREFDKITDF